MHIVIHESLDQALKEGKITRNPSEATRPPKVEKKEASFLNEDQMSKFLGEISSDRWYPAFVTVLGSGLRVGELAILKWTNVDLQAGKIHVKEAVSRVKNDIPDSAGGPKTKIIRQTPKTKRSLRSIPLPEDVVVELKRLKSRQAQEKLLLGQAYQDTGHVFTWPDGRMVDPGYLSKHFLKLVRSCGISNVHFHSLRHTYASMLLKANVHPKIVQENLGHATVGMVLDTYSHVMPGLKESAAAQLDGFTKIKRVSSAEEGR